MNTYDLIYFANSYDTQRFLQSMAEHDQHAIVSVRNPREVRVDHRTSHTQLIAFALAVQANATYIILSEL